MGCSSSAASRIEHNVIPVSQQTYRERSNVKDSTLCEKHGGKSLTKYDEKDNKLYCDVCISISRRGSDRDFHRHLQNISEYVNSIKFKQKKIKVENDVRSKKRDVQALLADAGDNATTLESQKGNLIEEVNNFRKAVTDILNHLCDELIERVLKLYKAECLSIGRRKKTYSEYLQKLELKETNDLKVQNTETLKLINIIEMEKCLSSLSKQNFANHFVDIQLKLHDNLSLRNLLHCDQSASTLGEVILLRNTKSERPCTKELIVHDLSDIQESDPDDTNDTQDTITESIKETEDDKGKSNSVRSKTPRRSLNVNSATDAKLFIDKDNRTNLTPLRSSTPRTRLQRNSIAEDESLIGTSLKESRASLRSKTPRIQLESNSASDAAVLTNKAQTESTPRLPPSLTSSMSITTPSAINFHTPFSDRKLFERNAILVQSISLPVSNKTSDVTSSVLLPNGDIILCDRSNRKLWHFDEAFHHLNDLWLDNEPHNICNISDAVSSYDLPYKIAVSFPKARLIHIVQITSDKFEKVDEIRTEPECWGIDSKGKSLIFSTEQGAVFRDVGDYRNFRWRKYRYAFQKPISLRTDKDVVYVCNWGSEEVPGYMVAMYYDDKGKKQIKFSYSNRHLRRPISCSVDSEENIYICDAENAGIHQVSCDGDQFRVLNVNGGQTSSWQHINFVPESDYFLLTEAGSNLLYICQMK